MLSAVDRKFIKKDYPAENHLIKLCCRITIDRHIEKNISELLQKNLNWEFIVRKARKEDISPLLYYNLRNIKPEVSQDYFCQLKEDYYNTTALNLFINQEFFRILGCFKEKGIPIVPLKGVALIQGIYPDIGLRRMGDVDLLVKRAEMKNACDILKDMGYVRLGDYFTNIDSYSPYINSILYRKVQDRNTTVHLHWHLVNTTLPLLNLYRIEMEEIWRELYIEYFQGNNFTMLSPINLLLYLSMHALHHSFEKLTLLCDIQEAIRFYKDRLDWDLVVENAERYNLSRPLYYSLYLCREILGSYVNNDILLNLKRASMGFCEKRFFSSIVKNNSKSINLSYPVYLGIAEGVIKKIRFILQTFFPFRYHLSQIKQGNINLFCYLKRVVQGVRQAIRIAKVDIFG